MPSWTIKAALQRAVAALPYPHFWNGLLQKHVSRSLHLSRPMFESRLAAAARHLAHWTLAAPNGSVGRAEVVEIGTGWFPVVPLALWLSGVAGVRSLDLHPHVDGARLAETVGRFLEADAEGRLAHLLPGLQADRLVDLRASAADQVWDDPVSFLRRHGVEYRAADLMQAGLAEGSADLVVSYSVLQYLPRPVLAAMLAEFRRLLRPGGVSSHWVDLADEYAYFDHSIGRFNFLRFSDRAWGWISNSLLPLSRLRLPDYRAALAEAGFVPLVEEPLNADPAELRRTPLAEKYRAMDVADLLPLSVWLAAIPAEVGHKVQRLARVDAA